MEAVKQIIEKIKYVDFISVDNKSIIFNLRLLNKQINCIQSLLKFIGILFFRNESFDIILPGFAIEEAIAFSNIFEFKYRDIDYSLISYLRNKLFVYIKYIFRRTNI